MTRLFRNATFWGMLLITGLQAQGKYDVSLDLVNVTRETDQVKVTISTPPVMDDKIVYALPAVIPGSYSRKDYGRFVHRFYALDAAGNPLKVKKLDENRILIRNPKKLALAKIEYWVDDTWDAEKKSPKQDKADFNYIFQPGGTNIDAGRNYVLNMQGILGYIEGYDQLPYKITVMKTAALYGATSATIERSGPGKDVITASRYSELVDNPVMYAAADTIGIRIGKTRLSVAVFSENNKVSADKVMQALFPVSNALGNFLGKLPVDHYQFIFYFAQKENNPLTKYGGFGALEHNYCSFYFLPELPSEQETRRMIQRVAAHEFLHILTPLNLHSEEIEHFRFNQPRMSAHLWLYEGVTEYFAQLCQVRDSLIDDETFIKIMRDKIERAAAHKDVSFTDMSRNMLSPEYNGMYSNVYDKGALIAFLLDIRLNELSHGKMNLRDLLLQLSAKYGPDKPFKDDELIPEIIAMTYPEIGTFFERYVIGNDPLPYQAYFDYIGWNYFNTRDDSVATFGKFSMYFDQKADRFIVTRAKEENRFGLLNGDQLLRVNDKEITYKNFETVLEPVFSPWYNLPVSVVFIREGKEQVATARPVLTPVTGHFILYEDPTAKPEKVKLRQHMLSNYAKD